MTVVYPNRLFYQSIRFQGLVICLTWIYGFVYPFPFFFTGYITYNVDNQICQKPLKLSFYEIYGVCFGYIIYLLKLVRYVKEMSQTVTSSNTLSRAKRELKMVRRIVILITILVADGFPFTLIMFMAFFHSAPRYHFRISYIFVDASILSVMFSLFLFTDPLKASITKKMTMRPNIVTAIDIHK